MKKLLLFCTVVGLLTGVSFAQRGRAVGGVGPTAGRMTSVGPIAPNARISPNAVNIGHNGIAPNATSIGANPKTVAPNSTAGATATSTGTTTTKTGPNTNKNPDHVVVPEAVPTGTHAGVGPDQ